MNKFKKGDIVKVITEDKDHYAITKSGTIWTVQDPNLNDYSMYLQGNSQSPEFSKKTNMIQVDKRHVFPYNSDLIRKKLGVK